MFERYVKYPSFAQVPLFSTYSVDMDGNILMGDGSPVITTFNELGEKIAWMYLWDGWRHYKVAEVIAHTFKPTFLPLKYWNEVTVMYRNGDLNNIHPENLVWKFPPGLGSIQRPGLAYIPMFSRYVISKSGEIFNAVTGRHITCCTNDRGYKLAFIRPDIGKSFTVGRHRLLALAWKEYPANVDHMHVDHVDGVPGHDTYANLDWVTARENQMRAMRLGLKVGLCEVLVKNLKTGEVSEYETLPECGKAYGICAAGVLYRLRNKARRIYPGYLLFKRKDDPAPWREVSDEELAEFEKKITERVLARDIFTGDVYDYPDIGAAADELGIKYHALYHLLTKSDQPVLDNGMQIRMTSIHPEWRKITDPKAELDVAKYGLAVLVRDIVTGEVTEYPSAAACSEAFGFCELTIAVRLRDNKQSIFDGKYQFKRKVDPAPWKDPDTVKKAQAIIPVKIRDIFTGEVKQFDCLKEAEEFIGCSQSALTERIFGKVIFPYKRFEVKGVDQDWEVFDQRSMEFFTTAAKRDITFKGRGYVLTNVHTGEVKLFISAIDVMAFLKCGKSTLSPVATAGAVFRNTWRIEYHFQTPGLASRDTRMKPIELTGNPSIASCTKS